MELWIIPDTSYFLIPLCDFYRDSTDSKAKLYGILGCPSPRIIHDCLILDFGDALRSLFQIGDELVYVSIWTNVYFTGDIHLRLNWRNSSI